MPTFVQIMTLPPQACKPSAHSGDSLTKIRTAHRFADGPEDRTAAKYKNVMDCEPLR
jgi:hypothetical protein